MKRKIRLTELDLRRIVKESVNEIYSSHLEKAVNASPIINKSNDAFINTYINHNGEKREYRRTEPFDWDYATAANGIRYIKEVLDSYEESYHGTNYNAQIHQCQKCLEYINNFLYRKSMQRNNLYSGYEDYYENEKNAFYEATGKLLGIDPKNKKKIDDILSNLPDNEWDEIVSKLPEKAKHWVMNNY